jgi:signal transduction histidine kinase
VQVPVLAAGRTHAVVALCSLHPVRHIEGWDLSAIEDIVTSVGGILFHLHALETHREALRQLVAVDEMRRELVSILAHDLRAPMTVIGHMAQMVHDDWDVMTEPEKLDYLQRIRAKARMSARFVDELLEVTRVEAGDMDVRSVPFDVRQVVEAVLAEFRTLWPDREFRLDVTEPVPSVVGDDRRQWQILSNLLTNACKYSKEGTPIRVTVQTMQTTVRVAVRDRGVGIAEVHQQRIFDKFQQFGEAADRHGSRGTGLGLYICRSLVEAQNGTISVESAVGRGSEFAYTVPREVVA